MLVQKKKLYAPRDDRAAYDSFIEAGVIVPYQHKQVAGQQICSCCADGFRIHIKDHVLNTCRKNGGANTFFHSLSGNGEALRFAFNSPLSEGYSERGNDDVLGMNKVKEIVESLKIAENKGVRIVQHRLVHHWPCSAAMFRGITFAKTIDIIIRGKLRIKQQIPGLQVAMDLFCDWENQFTTNLIKKEPYLQLLETDPRFERQHDEWCKYAEEVESLPVLRVISD